MATVLDPITGQPYEGRGLAMVADYVARTDGQPVYVGWAVPGSATSQAVWKITKMTYDGNNQMTSRLWAVDAIEDKALFNQVWDNRAALSYS